MQGINIKIQLIKRHKTQRWLLKKLQKRGFSTLNEPRFSDILNNNYTVGCANAVLEAAEKILHDVKTVKADK